MQRRTEYLQEIFSFHRTRLNNFHPHDLLHLAKCSENNPMRIDEVMIEDKNVNSAVEQISEFHSHVCSLYPQKQILRIPASKPYRTLSE